MLDNKEEYNTVKEACKAQTAGETLHEFYNDKRDFISLNAWIKCKEVKNFFYKKIIPLLPKVEKYYLNILIRKATASITANMQKVTAVITIKKVFKFYRISRGPLFELKDHLISCYDFKYINNGLKEDGETLIESAKITLNGYINYVRKKIKM